MIEGLGIAVIGVFVISRIIVDIWPFQMPGRLGAMFGAEAKKDHERHPVGYWLERIVMMANRCLDCYYWRWRNWNFKLRYVEGLAPSHQTPLLQSPRAELDYTTIQTVHS
jgi:hypothetical protein